MPAENPVISFRVPEGEYEAIQRAAQALGESMSSFVRKAIAYRLQGVVGHTTAALETTPYFATGTPYIQQDIQGTGKELPPIVTGTPLPLPPSLHIRHAVQQK